MADRRELWDEPDEHEIECAADKPLMVAGCAATKLGYALQVLADSRDDDDQFRNRERRAKAAVAALRHHAVLRELGAYTANAILSEFRGGSADG